MDSFLWPGSVPVPEMVWFSKRNLCTGKINLEPVWYLCTVASGWGEQAWPWGVVVDKYFIDYVFMSVHTSENVLESRKWLHRRQRRRILCREWCTHSRDCLKRCIQVYKVPMSRGAVSMNWTCASCSRCFGEGKCPWCAPRATVWSQNTSSWKGPVRIIPSNSQVLKQRAGAGQTYSLLIYSLFCICPIWLVLQPFFGEDQLPQRPLVLVQNFQSPHSVSVCCLAVSVPSCEEEQDNWCSILRVRKCHTILVSTPGIWSYLCSGVLLQLKSKKSCCWWQHIFQILLCGCRSAAETSGLFLLHPGTIKILMDEFCTGCKVLKFPCAPVGSEFPHAAFLPSLDFLELVHSLWDTLVVKWKCSFSGICAECGS